MHLLPLLTALIAGFAHALEPDHMAAVTTFVSRRPGPAKSVAFGVRWGVGHSAALLVVGLLLVALDLRVPERLTRGLEFGVGGMLLGLGAWLLWSVLHERAHRMAARGGEHDHAHPHTHRHGSLWVGMAHGLAGTAPLVALLPAALTRSAWLAGAYLLFFGVGTTVAMGLYAVAAGLLFDQAGTRVPTLGRTLRTLTAVGSATLGIVWMAGALSAA
ncbi:sulfite exporter TauE/SafE family protein [Longimicrobium sp.]|uniref:urease accessory protein UreH domain-containing protein n=1 Tax=Longimicrobium sp. TaxID=2029185 RepID=UPI002BF147E9|nr:sulfite exporter TauE/SafE family protein [Longimicrobium sp.]HSU13320.1 sulfite exporter TauE/SafE family protein [Longimicrobium sp.]